MARDDSIKRIHISGKYWTVVLANKRRGFASDELDGVTAYDTRTIYLARRLGKKQRSSTLLHEILHVIIPDEYEQVVRKIEKDLFSILWKDGWRPYGDKK